MSPMLDSVRTESNLFGHGQLLFYVRSCWMGHAYLLTCVLLALWAMENWERGLICSGCSVSLGWCLVAMQGCGKETR